MRIIIASTPKTGNIWAKCLLANIYNLKILSRPPKNEKDLKDRISEGWFEENSIFHQHFSPTTFFFNLVDSIDCKIVTTIRNPYDSFVSLFYFVQNFPKQFNRPEHPLRVLYGKTIDHADVLDYISRDDGFGRHIYVSNKWVESERTTFIRYENLHRSPFLELKETTDCISPTIDEVIGEAIQACSAEKMRREKKNWEKHIRKGEIGDWQNHLTEAHLDIFRRQYGELIEKLGYEVA
jgi:hypothetical protein